MRKMIQKYSDNFLIPNPTIHCGDDGLKTWVEWWSGCDCIEQVEEMFILAAEVLQEDHHETNR